LKKNQVKPGPLRQQPFTNHNEPDHPISATSEAAVFFLHFSAGT
jgi:hypothetical protein